MKKLCNNYMNILLSLKNPCTFLLAKEKTWKDIFNSNSELSQNYTEKELCHLKQQLIGYLIIYDVIYSLLVLIEKLQVANVYYILQVF